MRARRMSACKAQAIPLPQIYMQPEDLLPLTRRRLLVIADSDVAQDLARCVQGFLVAWAHGELWHGVFCVEGCLRAVWVQKSTTQLLDRSIGRSIGLSWDGPLV